MVTILMMSAKMATVGLLKTKIFWNKGYNVIASTDKILSWEYIYIYICVCVCVYVCVWSCDQSLVTLAFLWEKISQLQFYKDFTRKTTLFERWSWSKFINLGLTQGTALKMCTSVGKGLKLNVRKFSMLICTFVEVTGEQG